MTQKSKFRLKHQPHSRYSHPKVSQTWCQQVLALALHFWLFPTAVYNLQTWVVSFWTSKSNACHLAYLYTSLLSFRKNQRSFWQFRSMKIYQKGARNYDYNRWIYKTEIVLNFKNICKKLLDWRKCH